MLTLPGEKWDKSRKLVILDLSSPRNVSTDVGRMDGVILKTLENIRSVADATLAKRKEIVKHAEPIVEGQAVEVFSLLRRRSAEPMVSEIYHRANLVRAKELERAVSRLDLDTEQRKVLEKMSISLVEKILGPPANNLRKAAEKGDQQILTAAGHIFKED